MFDYKNGLTHFEHATKFAPSKEKSDPRCSYEAFALGFVRTNSIVSRDPFAGFFIQERYTRVGQVTSESLVMIITSQRK